MNAKIYVLVSLTTYVRKIMERIVRKALIPVQGDNELLPDSWFVFRSGGKDLTQLFQCYDWGVETIIELLERGCDISRYSKGF